MACNVWHFWVSFRVLSSFPNLTLKRRVLDIYTPSVYTKVSSADHEQHRIHLIPTADFYAAEYLTNHTPSSIAYDNDCSLTPVLNGVPDG
jgi:hypothetical protein